MNENLEKINPNKLIIGTLLVVFLVIMIWKVLYVQNSYSLVIPFLVLITISYSFIEIKIYERSCFISCYFNEKTLLATILTGRIFLILLFVIFSIMMTISLMYSLIDYEMKMWIYLIVQIVFMVILYKFFLRKFSKIIKEHFLEIFVRELIIKISHIFLLGFTIYLIMNGFEPDYLTHDLQSSISNATNSISSKSEITEYIFRLKREIDAIFWWSIVNSTEKMQEGAYKTLIWSSFIIINCLAILGINRFIGQIIYLLNKLFKEKA
jgi:hypothetical protein